MKGPPKIVGISFLLVALVMGGIGLWYLSLWKTYSWNQKLTVTVQTPEGEVSGASVFHVTVHRMEPCMFRGQSLWCFDTEASGEAVVVELPNGVDLFALPDRPIAIAERTFGDRVRQLPAAKSGLVPYEEMTALTGNHPVPDDSYPTMVFFARLSMPPLAEVVDPQNLEASFGSGYGLLSVTLELTDEPVMFGRVERHLPKGFLSEHVLIDLSALGIVPGDPRPANIPTVFTRSDFIKD